MALRDLFVRIKGDKTQLDSTLKGAGQSVNNFGNIVKKLGALLAATFGVTAIINFTKESIKLAAQVEGIRKGFQQIAEPGLLDDLRKATKGTVSDMQLMSRAVQASNFQIPLKDLAKLLEFASARAVQTGQSVDYLVDSIVLGIGRKSPLILDNLGISAVRLRQLLKGPGVEMATVGDIAEAVGNIATEELKKMGGMAETAGVKMQQLASAWANFKTSFGEKLTQSPLLQGLIDTLTKALTGMSGTDFAGMNTEELQKEKTRLEEKEKYHVDEINRLNKEADELNILQIAKKNKLNKLAETQNEHLKITVRELEKVEALLQSAAGIKPTPAVIERQTAMTKITGLKVPGLQDLNKSIEKEWFSNIGADVSGGLAESNTKLEREMTKMEEILTSGRDMVIDLGQQLAEGLGEALAGGNTKDIGKNLLLSFANFLGQFGKMLFMAGLGIEAFVRSTASLNAPLAIAAGIAMMVAAGAVKGLIGGASKQVASGASGGGGYAATTNLQSQKIIIEGKLSGRNIYWSNRRYESELKSST
jgi:hypothetical protein